MQRLWLFMTHHYLRHLKYSSNVVFKHKLRMVISWPWDTFTENSSRKGRWTDMTVVRKTTVFHRAPSPDYRMEMMSPQWLPSPTPWWFRRDRMSSYLWKLIFPKKAVLICLARQGPEYSAFFLKESKGECEEGVAGDPRSPLPFYFFLE